MEDRMPVDIDDVIAYLRRHHRAAENLEFINELEGFFADHPEVIDAIDEGDDARFVSVSFDRRKNDNTFNYYLFDILLKALDRASGGHGVRKPVNQLRVIRWANTRDSLRTTLLSARAYFPILKFRGLLILPYRPVGWGLDPSFMQI
jgi:hypothetical protein